MRYENAKSDDTMKRTIERVLFLLVAITVASCAGAKVADETQNAPAATAIKPDQIVIYPFAVNATDVTLNQSIVQRAYRNVSGEDQSASQQKIATDTASNVCESVAANLTAKGYKAVCLTAERPRQETIR